MKVEKLQENVDIPSGVTVSVTGNAVTVKGPKGEVVRQLSSKRIAVAVREGKVVLEAPLATKREKTLLYTYRAHVLNMIKGVTQGHEYKLRICSGHFPMNVSLKGDYFEIRNFIGEVVPRRLVIKKGVDVKIDGDRIVVTGIDKELVAQTAASIEALTRRPGFDSRIFQDGIYITEKDGKQL